MPFYQGFTLDTLLGSISCILGIVALFVGGKAYKKCKVVESSLNDQKEFNDNSSDHSQRAAGNIVNNNCDVDALAKITTANFETALNQAYSVFDQQTKTNLQQILEQTKKIILEQKPNLAGLTKVDWINIYFESAKNTSDSYMQNIWAKVLAKELEIPGSFSFKTLDILKNMSSDDFRLFEKMLLLQVEGFVLQKEVESNQHLHWAEFQRLREHGLINLESSKWTISIKANDYHLMLIGNKYVLRCRNDSNDELSFEYPGYLLSTAAKEIACILSIEYPLDYALIYAGYVKEAAKKTTGITISLHKVNHITEKLEQPGKYNINYFLEELK